VRSPITEITDLHVIAIIKAKRKTPVRARNLLALAKRFFRWAVAQRVYGLSASPCAALNAIELIGDNAAVGRDRVLNDAELRALWLAADGMGYPHGRVYQMLMLTGLRRNEVADASWSEFDLSSRIWTIPASRMKGKNAGKRQARPHAVPLNTEILATLEKLPRFKSGDYLFSSAHGESPVWLGAKIKDKVDAAMLALLRADNAEELLPNWTNHDIRRTVRTHLSKLGVRDVVAESVLAHVKPGIEAVYNIDDLVDAKRKALDAWSARLRSIVTPPQPKPSNVVAMHAAAPA